MPFGQNIHIVLTDSTTVAGEEQIHDLAPIPLGNL